MKRKGVLCFIQKEEKVLLVQFDYGNGALIWNGLSGFIDLDEDPKQAVLREVKEEIGIDLDISSLVYKGTRLVSDELDLELFTATKWAGTPEPKEESVKDIRWFEIDDLPFDQMFPGNKEWLPALLQKAPTLYIMCGLGFSGKSTLAKHIAQHFQIPIVSTDEMFWELKLKSGDYQGWLELLRVSKERVSGFLKNGQSVVYDYTSEKREQRDELRALAEKAGALTTTVYLATSNEEVFRRQMENKETHERHDPEQEDLDAVKHNFEVPIEAEGNIRTFTATSNISSFLQDLGK